MHMSDALVSPAVAGSLWVATAGASTLSARALRRRPDDRRVPLMGVLGAFVFAAQMVNFTIPGTGSSGHLCGGLLLAILLGPAAAFLVMASVLSIQALFFADGGLLALGCNIVNLGLATSFVAYPLVFAPLAHAHPSRSRLVLATVLAAVVGLQLGSLGVVAETLLSGRTPLSAGAFLALMQPIHLAIGLVEGLVTSAVVLFLRDARPDLVQGDLRAGRESVPPRRVGARILFASAVTAGLLSLFASSAPDGLEWSLARATRAARPEPAGPLHELLSRVQEHTAVLAAVPADGERLAGSAGGRPRASAAASLSGLAGSALTLGLAGLLAAGLRGLRRGSRPSSSQ
ncbi:MAG TPA: energy-coupling factor ABC transporter permease [Anaeromyxobacteraceae bacterium]|nr:energy-coupling factor ABC transporter permease [Anaeromyxobacteraceae bacterium]